MYTKPAQSYDPQLCRNWGLRTVVHRNPSALEGAITRLECPASTQLIRVEEGARFFSVNKSNNSKLCGEHEP